MPCEADAAGVKEGVTVGDGVAEGTMLDAAVEVVVMVTVADRPCDSCLPVVDGDNEAMTEALLVAEPL